MKARAVKDGEEELEGAMNLLLIEEKQGMRCIFPGIYPAFSKRKDAHF
jgi:hypothetical protein